MIGVMVVGGVVEVMRMTWFVERRVWLLWWEDGGSEAACCLRGGWSRAWHCGVDGVVVEMRLWRCWLWLVVVPK